jgi:hypothetical protein
MAAPRAQRMSEGTETSMRMIYARLLISGALFAAVLAFVAFAPQHEGNHADSASRHVGAAQ